MTLFAPCHFSGVYAARRRHEPGSFGQAKGCLVRTYPRPGATDIAEMRVCGRDRTETTENEVERDVTVETHFSHCK